MIRFITRSFSDTAEKENNPKIKAFVKSSAFTSYSLPALVDIDKVISLLPENPSEEDCAKVLKLSLFSFMGTDGMRGKVSVDSFGYMESLRKYIGENLITVPLLELSIAAFVRMLKETGRRLDVCIGNDSRDKATEWTLVNAVKNSFLKGGVKLSNLGVVPTPYVPQFMLANNIQGGAVLTASHNPSNQNGIKFFFDGKKLLSDGKDGDFILSAYMVEFALAEKIPDEKKYDAVEYDYLDEAVKFLNETVKPEYRDKIAKTRIIADAANGAWSLFAKKYFEDNGMNVLLLNCKPEGENINHNCGVAEIEGHASFTKEELAAAPEVIRRVYDEGKASKESVYGIAVDGDGDRGFVMKYDAASDSVIVYDGDAEAYLIETLIHGDSGKKKTAVYTIESDLMVGIEMQEKFGLEPKMVDVGDKWICNQNAEELAIGFESSGHAIVPCMAGGKILLTGNGLLTALLTIASMEDGNASFEKGYSNTLYTYFVKKELFYNGSPLWNEDAEVIKAELAKLSGVSYETVSMKDPNVLVFSIFKDAKKCALIFIRNSGTEDKNAVYLKCRNGFENSFLPVTQKIRELHREKMLDPTREEVVFEKKILEIIKEKGVFEKKDISGPSGTIESALHALVKERVICNKDDSYHPL
ncbi:MAG: hypothetical protein J6Z17_02140 [Treponema sp.]|nr:hypothetical protein [Treponema sp.]